MDRLVLCKLCQRYIGLDFESVDLVGRQKTFMSFLRLGCGGGTNECYFYAVICKHGT